MKMKELINYSAKILKGKRATVLLACLLPLCGGLLFRLAEASMYSLLLYFGDMKPLELFTGKNSGQLAISVLCTVFRWVCTAPMYYASAVRLTEFCSEKSRKYTPLSKILISRNCFRKSFLAMIIKKIISLLTLTPVVFFGIITYGFVDSGEFFPFMHSLAVTLLFFVMWLNVKVALSAVYFVMVLYPEKGVFGVIFKSFRLMKGRRKYISRLASIYFFPMLTVIAIPFLLPEFMTAYSLSIAIFTKEDEYFERNKIHGRIGKSNNRPKLSYRKKRRFKAYADTLETP